eukprot:gb/GECG01009970.1/.p1 GENE.gb/GECG01009970.1/~~gb/GECG01009970.1/.p1  ORF type:complete len:528 (+),score=62.20 gb/GECG01009970.1/:1-1584(+)
MWFRFAFFRGFSFSIGEGGIGRNWVPLLLPPVITWIQGSSVALDNDAPGGSESASSPSSVFPWRWTAKEKEDVFGEYENRIRFHSAPAKVFEYFASVHNEKTKQSFMVPQDVLRAIIPYNPHVPAASRVHSTGSNNIHFQFNAIKQRASRRTKDHYKQLLRRIWEDKDEEAFQEARELRLMAEQSQKESTPNGRAAVDLSAHVTCLSELGIPNGEFQKHLKAVFGPTADLIYVREKANHELTDLLDQDLDGLISYSEFILLLSVLSIKTSRALTLFKVLDTSGDGKLDQHEFQLLLSTIRNNTPFGQQVVSAENSIGAVINRWTLFFAEDDGKISPNTFCNLIAQVKDAILWEEFKSYDTLNKGYLTPKEFARFATNYSTAESRMVFEERMQRLSSRFNESKITFDQVRGYSRLMERADLLYTSLQLLLNVRGKDAAGEKTLQRAFSAAMAAKESTGSLDGGESDLSLAQIHVLLTLFDDNGDGKISFEELVGALERKRTGHLSHPRQGKLLRSKMRKIKECIRKYW